MENTPTGPVIHREPMSGLPTDTDPDHVPEKMAEEIERAKQELRAAVRGDDAWRHPDLMSGEGGPITGDDPEAVDNMVEPIPEIYKLAHQFMAGVFGEDNYTPDSVGQLLEVFVPCLRIMCDRPYEPTGALWRKAGVFGPLIDAYKKWDRFWYRTWTKGIRHDDSGFDLINFVGFTLRAAPKSRFGELGEPAPPEATDA